MGEKTKDKKASSKSDNGDKVDTKRKSGRSKDKDKSSAGAATPPKSSRNEQSTSRNDDKKLPKSSRKLQATSRGSNEEKKKPPKSSRRLSSSKDDDGGGDAKTAAKRRSSSKEKDPKKSKSDRDDKKRDKKEKKEPKKKSKKRDKEDRSESREKSKKEIRRGREAEKKKAKKSSRNDDDDDANKKKEKKQSKKEAKKKTKQASKKPSTSSSSSTAAKATCCICRDAAHDDDLVGGLCEHAFCTSCVENLLHKPMAKQLAEDNHLAAPTLGRCPECGQALRKFDLLDLSSSPSTSNSKKKITTSGLKYKRVTKLKDTPIYGLVFQPADGVEQLGDFHFDMDEKADSGLPYMDFSRAIESNQDQWILNDGEAVPAIKHFEEGCFYDPATRTFHGTLLWKPITFKGAFQWDCVIGFNKDFSAIQAGVIHERKERILDKKTHEKASECKAAAPQGKKNGKKSKKDEGKSGATSKNEYEHSYYRYLYPLDGKWRLGWTNIEGKEQTGAITVRNNEFQQGQYLFNLNFKDPETPQFRWPLDPVFATAKKGHGNLKKRPMGPSLGEKIVWETTHPAFSEITWERDSYGDPLPPIPRTTHFGVANHAYVSTTPGRDRTQSGEDEREDVEEKSTKRDNDVNDDDASTSGSSSNSDSSSGSSSSSSSSGSSSSSRGSSIGSGNRSSGGSSSLGSK